MTTLFSVAAKIASEYIKSRILQLLDTDIRAGKIEVTLKDPRNSTTSAPIKCHSGDEHYPSDLVAYVAIIDKPDVWLRLFQNLDIGIAESYMLRDLECSDLVSLFQIYIRNWSTMNTISSMFYLPMRLWTQILKRSNSTENALKNAVFHYDTSNDHFQSFLSEDMSYSCPIWEQPEEPLEAAQVRKAHTIIRKAGIESDHYVLDVGGGWGFIAMEAVRLTGCRVTVNTLSTDQKELGESLIKAGNLDDKIEYRLCDYRNVPRPNNGYDRVISIEMIEHVGQDYLDKYFRVLHQLVNPEHGRIVVQGIVFTEKLHSEPKTIDNFLDKYIFPGGYLPGVTEIVNSLNRGSDKMLNIDSIEDIGEHYAKALRLWREKFIANWETTQHLYTQKHGLKSSDKREAFKRTWIYYFSYCQAGFLEGILGDIILVASRRPRIVSNPIFL